MKTFQLYRSHNELPKSWDEFVSHDVFLQSNYFKALEEASPNNIQWFYIGVFTNETLVGVAIIQRVQLYLKDMFRKTTVSCVKGFFKDIVARVLKGNVLVVGNVMHTGQHAVFFDSSAISQVEFFDVVFRGLKTLTNTIKTTQGKSIRAIIVKDFFVNDTILDDTSIFKSHKLLEVRVQPNMILPIHEDWRTMNDYINALHKKYRDRYKRARKKLGEIKSRELNLEAIEEYSKQLHELYLNVSNNAKFNTFILPENHFYNLKLQLQESFKVYGCFLDDKLVGFYTLILNDKALETYFLGYDEAHQYPNQLYLNMLYDMLQFGIENEFSNVVYARTAMAIKSSVGAKAKPMVVYMKHTNGVMNALLKPIFKLMNPKRDWEERHPFKS